MNLIAEPHYGSDSQVAKQLSLRDQPDQLGVILIVWMERLGQILGLLLNQIFNLTGEIGAQALCERRHHGLNEDLDRINTSGVFAIPATRGTSGPNRHFVHIAPPAAYAALHNLNENDCFATSTHSCLSVSEVHDNSTSEAGVSNIAWQQRPGLVCRPEPDA